jgi:ribonucleotide monophosphatase NagD (HAD superfamily)
VIRAVSFDLANTLVRGGDAIAGAGEALAAGADAACRFLHDLPRIIEAL